MELGAVSVLLLLLLVLPSGRARAGGVNGEGLTNAEYRAVQKYVGLRTQEVYDLIEKGRFEEAEKLARALLVIAPDTGGDTGLLKTLKNRARDGMQSQSIAGGELRLPEGYLEVGDPIIIKVVITNRSLATLEVDMGDGEDGGGAAAVRVTFEESGALGGVRVDEWTLPVRSLRGTRTLEPGESWEVEVVIDSASHSPVNPTIRTYRVTGEVWPLAMKVGARPVVRPIRLKSGICRIHPRGLQPMRSAPLETLREGLEEEFAPKVVLAAGFVGDELYGEAVEILIAGQERTFDNPAMGRSLRVALR
ncbi:MAG: hypothetical protein ACYTFG_02535, partial [Planctomycetota bacterium]